MAGYSAKPLWGKLGFAASARVLLVDAPRGFSIAGAPEQLKLAREARGQGESQEQAIVAFFSELADLHKRLPRLAGRIFPGGAMWVAWPRRAGGHDSDIREQDIREQALELGLVDVKVAALDEHWSGLRLVWRVERRGDASAGRR